MFIQVVTFADDYLLPSIDSRTDQACHAHQVASSIELPLRLSKFCTPNLMPTPHCVRDAHPLSLAQRIFSIINSVDLLCHGRCQGKVRASPLAFPCYDLLVMPLSTDPIVALEAGISRGISRNADSSIHVLDTTFNYALWDLGYDGTNFPIPLKLLLYPKQFTLKFAGRRSVPFAIVQDLHILAKHSKANDSK